MKTNNYKITEYHPPKTHKKRNRSNDSRIVGSFNYDKSTGKLKVDFNGKAENR